MATKKTGKRVDAPKTEQKAAEALSSDVVRQVADFTQSITELMSPGSVNSGDIVLQGRGAAPRLSCGTTLLIKPLPMGKWIKVVGISESKLSSNEQTIETVTLATVKEDGSAVTRKWLEDNVTMPELAAIYHLIQLVNNALPFVQAAPPAKGG